MNTRRARAVPLRRRAVGDAATLARRGAEGAGGRRALVRARGTHEHGATFDLYPDTRSQVYGGIAAETPSTTARGERDRRPGRALRRRARADVLLLELGRPHRQSSRTSGVPSAVPYLVSVPDPYDSLSPYHDWGPFAVTARSCSAAKLDARGRLLDVRTSAAASGRVRTVTRRRLEGRSHRQGRSRAAGARAALDLVHDRDAGPRPAGEGADVRLDGEAERVLARDPACDARIASAYGGTWTRLATLRARGRPRVGDALAEGDHRLPPLDRGSSAAVSSGSPSRRSVRLSGGERPHLRQRPGQAARCRTRPVQVQRQAAGGWTTVAATTVDRRTARSTASLKPDAGDVSRPRRGRARATRPASRRCSRWSPA